MSHAGKRRALCLKIRPPVAAHVVCGRASGKGQGPLGEMVRYESPEDDLLGQKILGKGGKRDAAAMPPKSAVNGLPALSQKTEIQAFLSAVT